VFKQKKEFCHRNTNAFTLIEVLVVTALTVILMISSTALFLSFMASSSRVNYEQKIKSEGKTILDHVGFLLRNGKKINFCSENLTQLTITNLDEYETTLLIQNDGTYDRIASTSTATDTVYLSSIATSVNNLEFDCYENNLEKGQYVQVTFDLSLGNTDSNDPFDSYTQTFSQGILLRNTSF